MASRLGLLNEEEDLRLTPEEIFVYFDNKLTRGDRILSLEGSMPNSSSLMGICYEKLSVWWLQVF